MNISSPKIFIGILVAVFLIAILELGARAEPAEAAGKLIVYRVRSGDTLIVLARRYRTTVRAIKRANGLRGDMIYIGQRLRIPTSARNANSRKSCGATYRVRKGDTLTKIARSCRTTVKRLRRLNKIPASARLVAGQVLRLKAGVALPAGDPSPSTRTLPVKTHPAALPTPSFTR